MKNGMKLATAAVVVAMAGTIASAQGKSDKMAGAMAKDKTYTGCIEAGAAAGSFLLTHAADASMEGHGMGKHAVKSDMASDAMGHDAMAPSSLAISSTSIDLGKHVGHKVSVTGMDAAMGMGKPDEMGKEMSAFSVTKIKMLAASCSM